MAPTTTTRAESFLWYSVDPRLKLGVAFLWKQGAFRALGSYQMVTETAVRPSLNASVGLQGIGTGNPGYSVTAEKNFMLSRMSVNAFAGLGFRTNENHVHPVGGFKVGLNQWLTVGFQHDGHEGHPFLTVSQGNFVGGVYLIGFKSPALLLGARF